MVIHIFYSITYFIPNYDIPWSKNQAIFISFSRLFLYSDITLVKIGSSMNVLEAWKKQITFLQNKDMLAVLLLALKRYMHLLLTIPGMLLQVSLYVSILPFLFYQHMSLLHLENIFISVAIFCMALFLRPSRYKKNFYYLFFMIKKKQLMLFLLALFSMFCSIFFLVPFLLFALTFLLLSLDGEDRIGNNLDLGKTAGIFLFYNLPIVSVLSAVSMVLIAILQYTIQYNKYVFFLFNMWLTASIFSQVALLFLFTYTVSVYENEQFFFK